MAEGSHFFFARPMPAVEAVAPIRGVTTGAMALILSRSSILSSHLTTARVTVFSSRLFAKKAEKIMANPKVFFDVAINNQNIGRLVMEVTISSCLFLCWNVAHLVYK